MCYLMTGNGTSVVSVAVHGASLRQGCPPRQGSVTIKKWDFGFLFQTVQDILKEPYSAFGGVAEYFTIKLICLQSLII